MQNQQILLLCVSPINKVVNRILHIVFAAAFCIIIGAFLVGIEIASGFVKGLGITSFARYVLELAVIALDFMLVIVFLVVIDHARKMLK